MDKPAHPDFYSLLWMVRDGEQAKLREWLRADPTAIGAEDEHGSSLLERAISDGRVEEVDLLLCLGARVDRKDDEGYTPLQRAIDRCERHIEIVRCLLDHGASIHQIGFQFIDSLHLAACRGWTEAVTLFLDRGADVDRRDQDFSEWTPLMYAAFCGHTWVAKLLLDRGAQPSLRHTEHETAAEVAEERGHTELAAMIRVRQL